MARFRNNLDHVRIAAPCKSDWDTMMGSEQVRFCSQCSLNVYNLSSITRAEAESLIARTEGRLCVKYYRRRDGSIITRDCPIGLRAIGRRVGAIARAIVSMALGLFAGLGVHEIASTLSEFSPGRTMGVIDRPDPRGKSMGKLAVGPRPVVGETIARKPTRHRVNSSLGSGPPTR